MNRDLRKKKLAAWEGSPRFEDFARRADEAHTQALQRRHLKELAGTPKRVLRKHGIDPDAVARATRKARQP